MIDEYITTNKMVTINSDFLRCSKCGSSELTMNTTSMSHGLVHDEDGVIIEYNCNKCDTELTLALFNGSVGNPQLTARINWVHKWVN